MSVRRKVVFAFVELGIRGLAKMVYASMFWGISVVASWDISSGILEVVVIVVIV